MLRAKTNFRAISDKSVRDRTGKSWKQWLAILDKFDVKENGHRLAAKFLGKRYKLGPWWSQAVTIHYEWVRRLRTVKNQRQVMPKHSLFKSRKSPHK